MKLLNHCLMVAAAVSMIPTASGVVRSPAWRTVTDGAGAVTSAYGAWSLPLPGMRAEDRARAFLSGLNPLSPAPDLTNLQLLSVDTDDTGDHVRFEQTYAGAPVLGAEVDVHLVGDRAYMASSTWRPEMPTEPGPRLAAIDAWTEGAHLAGIPGLTADTMGDRVVWPEANDSRWAWRFHAHGANGMPYSVVVDGRDGRTARATPLTLDLRAAIYPESPTATPVREPRELEHLDNSGYVQGPYTQIFQDAQIGLRGITGGKRIQVVNNDLNFSPGDGRAAAVGAFYHANRVHDFFRGLGVRTIDFPLPLVILKSDVRGEPFVNAMYSPEVQPKGMLAIGHGPEGTDFSLDADVIYHEYTHFVVNQVNHNLLTWQNVEAFAINEALADTGAASLTGNPCVAEFIAPTLAGLKCLRDLAGARHYPEDTGDTQRIRNRDEVVGFAEGHVLSQIFSSTLWDLKNVIGQDAFNALFVASFGLMNGNSRYPDARAALLSADRVLNQGANEKAVNEVFDAHGIKDRAVTYLEANAFSSLRNPAPVFIGPVLSGITAQDSLVIPGEISAAFVAGRSYDLTGFIASPSVQQVALSVDSEGIPVTSMAITQDLSKRSIPSATGEAGHDFDLPLRFPDSTAGKPATVTLTFRQGLRTQWSTGARVTVVPENGPAHSVSSGWTPPSVRLLGDGNHDGKVNLEDVVGALRLAIGIDQPAGDAWLAYDVSPTHQDGSVGDNVVDLRDALVLLRKVVGSRLRY